MAITTDMRQPEMAIESIGLSVAAESRNSLRKAVIILDIPTAKARHVIRRRAVNGWQAETAER